MLLFIVFIENAGLLFVKVMKALHILHLDNQEMKRKLQDIEAMLVANGLNLDLPRTFGEKHELSLPIPNLEAFQEFDNRLKSDSSFRYEFVGSQICIILFKQMPSYMYVLNNNIYFYIYLLVTTIILIVAQL